MKISKENKIRQQQSVIMEQEREIERLNKRVKKCEEAYLRTRHQYSELENKYLTDEYIINKLEKELKNNYSIWMCKARENGKRVQFGIDVCKTHFYNRLQELKGDSSNE